MRSRPNIPKPGRNDPCPCGSGKKYKTCHGNLSGPAVNLHDPMQLELLPERALAAQRQRAKQQGTGRPIISTIVGGRRFVAVGGQLFFSEKWKSFHDFLFGYLPIVFGRAWLDAEIQKPEDSRHPLLLAMQRAASARKGHERVDGVTSRVATGTEAFILDLAYNLYLLQHNAEIQATLLERLRLSDLFYGPSTRRQWLEY